MYVLYLAAIIWVLPVLSTRKKMKKGEPSNLTIVLGGKRWNLLSHLFWIPYLFMNSCSM